ncbi:MAG: ribosome biogenesis GTP-binding protein YihA/YsxC [Methylocella sp.]
MAVTDLAPDAGDFAELGRKLFSGECAFLWAAANPSQLPPPGPPEIAFGGRSNVGKSSLVNALTNRKTLARTSHTPGRTQELIFFGLGGGGETAPLRLIDMPGYGHAEVSKQKTASSARLIEDFLRGRVPLLRVFLLIDGRHGAKPIDNEILDFLDRFAISYQIVLTKQDQVKAAEREDRLAAALALVDKRPAAFPEVIFTSSRSGEGVAELRAAIARLLMTRVTARHETG